MNQADLTLPQHFSNRELSFLEFNERVLAQAKDPGVPLLEYTTEDIKREYLTKKDCAPFCTVNCVQQISIVDNWRDPQTLPDARPQQAPPAGHLVQL